jgi:hypothetical protein
MAACGLGARPLVCRPECLDAPRSVCHSKLAEPLPSHVYPVTPPCESRIAMHIYLVVRLAKMVG